MSVNSAGQSFMITDLGQVNSVPSNTLLIVGVSNSAGTFLRSITVQNFVSNNQVDISVPATNNLIVQKNSTPISSADNSVPKSIWFDDNYIYVTTANNVTKRVLLSTF